MATAAALARGRSGEALRARCARLRPLGGPEDAASSCVSQRVRGMRRSRGGRAADRSLRNLCAVESGLLLRSCTARVKRRSRLITRRCRVWVDRGRSISGALVRDSCGQSQKDRLSPSCRPRLRRSVRSAYGACAGRHAAIAAQRSRAGASWRCLVRRGGLSVPMREPALRRKASRTAIRRVRGNEWSCRAVAPARARRSDLCTGCANVAHRTAASPARPGGFDL